MAAQDERESGDIDMGEGLLDPMAQDEEVEQEMLVVEEEEQFFPHRWTQSPKWERRRQRPRNTTPPLPSSETLPRSLQKRLSRVHLT